MPQLILIKTTHLAGGFNNTQCLRNPGHQLF